MPNVLLSCGCRANGEFEGKPTCAIHFGVVHNIHVVETPNLAGRIARCDCGSEQPSNVELPFFEFRGVDSPSAKNNCGVCGGYAWVAHLTGKPHLWRQEHSFVAHGPYDHDIYYCGCRGWD